MQITLETLPKLIKRNPDSHKGDYGHSVIIAGSLGKAGAAYLTSYACLRAGSGLITCLYPKDVNLMALPPEVMSLPLGNSDYFQLDSAFKATAFIKEKTVACIGNGIGRNSQTKDFVKFIVSNSKLPIVIDADGINSLTIKDLDALNGRAIITPHMKEFSRLIDYPMSELLADKINLAKSFAKNYNVILVLKSHETIIATGAGEVFTSSFGNASLAKGGSGDVLAGIITALIAQKYSLIDSAKLGCYILGRSAELLDEHEMAATATDVINNFGKTLNELQRNCNK